MVNTALHDTLFDDRAALGSRKEGKEKKMSRCTYNMYFYFFIIYDIVAFRCVAS